MVRDLLLTSASDGPAPLESLRWAAHVKNATCFEPLQHHQPQVTTRSALFYLQMCAKQRQFTESLTSSNSVPTVSSRLLPAQQRHGEQTAVEFEQQQALLMADARV